MSGESRARGVTAGNNMGPTRQPDEEGESDGERSPHSTDSQMLINQLREITGIQDPAILNEALKASNNDITQAVSFLTDECAKEPEGNPDEPSEDKTKSAVVRFLNDKDELQTAIALSLQESTIHQVERNDSNDRCPDCICAENKNRAKRKRSEVWGNSPDPNDLRRNGDWPVGLKNIGNTCWFSAVIQSLFHLPEFRRLVHSYSISQSMLERCQSRSEKRNIAFMQELQCLFSLMVGSNRKFVDPSAAVELLKDAFLSEEAQQQDVCEFTHKLLDWLEDAFQLAVCRECSRDKTENPMVQLFYGTFLNEGYLEDKAFSNIETFGQYPLQVNGFNNLNECLEAAMLEKDLELSQTGQAVQYRQERWFTKLPPVLTFELSRFEYNQSLGQPEKIHNKLEFPEIIYMDRYLYRNKELIRKKRRDVRKLNRHIDYLHQKLERYLKYGSGTSRCPLPDMLRYVLEFAHAKSAARSHAVDLTRSAETPADDTTSPDSQPQENGLLPNGHSEHLGGDEARLPILEHELSSVQSFDESSMGSIEGPAPHSATKEELHSVELCLQRWRAEVEQDIEDLKVSIAKLTAMIDDIYNDSDLMQVPYRLHAVLVHEGQANAGHYWAYIYSHTRKCWLKYNDMSVTEATWEELQRDSFGGMKNASAYCLMYINDKLPYLIADSETGQLEDRIGTLPLHFVQYVREDNQGFEHEVEEWEEAHSCKIPQMEPVVTSEEASSPCNGSPLASEDSTRSLSSEHAMIAKEQTALAITKTAEAYERNGVEAALKEPQPFQPEPEEASQSEPSPPDQTVEKELQPSSQLSEVEIPSVGKILVRSDADGYNEETMLSPAMQGVILAILKARQIFDRDGPEAGLVKAFHEEYSRLCKLAEEQPSPSSDPRLQHVLVYFFQNKAPQRVIERTLLDQFADKNLSYDERSISIMKVAQAKLKEIGPNDLDMKLYQKWHEDYSQFRKVSVYLLTGLELYQKGKCQEALTYLVHAYQSNSALLSIGANRGVDGKLIELYRRKCLLELNDAAAKMFETQVEEQVSEGISIMNDLIIPCMHLIADNKISEEDLEAIEDMRSRWCSYLGQDINENLQLKLGQFLPRLLDCSSEDISLKEPPKIRPHSPYDLCNRFTAIMESIHGTSTVRVK
ncbi:ubiquitin carboxyl-terminal hydrolase 28 isoform X1 [Rana temporaria]|uniref:ubiquitin carboxyl-terminal hydrolase 28 isoform X1 n=1 Tax=Rana temporaria TaxID=8407 RepID=UPI001AAC9140|nr:ubiquitin carboxyl-terminal hydrolase 28 isoform X1 [Rana temporaria]